MKRVLSFALIFMLLFTLCMSAFAASVPPQRVDGNDSNSKDYTQVLCPDKLPPEPESEPEALVTKPEPKPEPEPCPPCPCCGIFTIVIFVAIVIVFFLLGLIIGILCGCCNDKKPKKKKDCSNHNVNISL